MKRNHGQFLSKGKGQDYWGEKLRLKLQGGKSAERGLQNPVVKTHTC